MSSIMLLKCDGCANTVEAGAFDPKLMPDGWNGISVRVYNNKTTPCLYNEEGHACSALCAQKVLAMLFTKAVGS